MTEQIFPQWRNSHNRTRYPFRDDASLLAADGTTSLPANLFDDARIYPPLSAVGVFLRRVGILNSRVELGIGTAATEIAKASYDPASVGNEIALVDAYGRPAGILVSDSARLSSVYSSMPPGDTLFTLEATEFVASVLVPLASSGVTALLADDNSLFSGDVVLCGTNGVVLSVEGGAIRVDAIGDPYAILKDCVAQGVAPPPYCGLKTINGIPPDANGDFKLTTGANISIDNFLRILLSGGTLTVKGALSGKGCS